MSLKDLLANGLIFRKILRSQEHCELHLQRIAESLERLANQLAPKTPEFSPADLTQTEVSYSRDGEQARALAFEEEIFRKLGRAPTEGEILDFLDGKPVGLGL